MSFESSWLAHFATSLIFRMTKLRYFIKKCHEVTLTKGAVSPTWNNSRIMIMNTPLVFPSYPNLHNQWNLTREGDEIKWYWRFYDLIFSYWSPSSGPSGHILMGLAFFITSVIHPPYHRWNGWIFKLWLLRSLRASINISEKYVHPTWVGARNFARISIYLFVQMSKKGTKILHRKGH